MKFENIHCTAEVFVFSIIYVGMYRHLGAHAPKPLVSLGHTEEKTFVRARRRSCGWKDIKKKTNLQHWLAKEWVRGR